MTVSREQRFTKDRPCPICSGYDKHPRGQGARCYGFLSDDGEWAHCTREDASPGLPLHERSDTYAHKLTGECACGTRHDLYPDEPSASYIGSRREVATYKYLAADGNLSYQVVRYAPKDFRQRRPDGRGSWIWNLDNTERVLYRLPGLLNADPEALVFVAEGEKDAEALAALGLVATTNAGGAGKWRDEYAECLRGRNVVILPDNDEAGRNHAAIVAGKLRGVAASVRVLALPNLPEKGDVSDWLAAGGTADALKALAERSEVFDSASHNISANSEYSEYSEQGNSDAEWHQPTPLRTHETLPPFPTDALPTWLRDFVEAEATATQTPPDLAGLLCLATVAATVAGKVRIVVKDGYTEPLNLYTLVAMPPANRKSAVFSDATAPLVAFEECEAARLRDSVDEAQARHRMKQAQVQHAETMAAKSKADARAEREAEVVTLRRELAALPPIPMVPRLIADDATPEKVASLLHEQGGRLAVLSPEGDVFELMAGRYSGNSAPNFVVFLKGHAGDDLRVDRQGRPREFVRCPALTLGLAVQPEVLRGLAQRPGFRGLGLLARFLWAVPASMVGYRDTFAPALPTTVRDAYAAHLTALLALTPSGTPSATTEPHILRLDTGARAFMGWLESYIERELREFGSLGAMPDWGGKLFGAVARIAGLLHLAEHAGTATPWAIPVQAHTVEAAWRIGEYLIPHARAAFAEMGTDPLVEDADALSRWLLHHYEATGETTVNKRTMQQDNRSRFKIAAEIDPALRLLVDHGYLCQLPQEARSGGGRKPSPMYEMNPLWLAQNTQNTQNSTTLSDWPRIGHTPGDTMEMMTWVR